MFLQRAWSRAVYARRIAWEVLPAVEAELARWKQRIGHIPNPELRRQAWASITSKRFHCEGGSVFAALRPQWAPTLVRLIVALQTISDYLDNLCDRSVSMDEADFRQLHHAMLDAVDDTRPLHDYYALHPNRDDGGYLQALVAECRTCLRRLPAYPVVRDRVRRLVGLYNDLQVYKHGPLERREPALAAWFHARAGPWRDLYWWEFAAACGSTLAVFALFAAAAHPGLTPAAAAQLEEAYFPWICGLHILLDYLIDQAEDAAGGDLNLVSYYPSAAQRRQRLVRFVREARARAQGLPDREFHETIVQGLPGLYLSDGKVPQQRLEGLALTLLCAGGPASFGYFLWCRLRRQRAPANA
ncbi:MAG: tetraprenyl-beta-curcumene synthase family protein [Limnochordales bacterium]